MSISKLMRNRRFRVNDTVRIPIVIENRFGERLELELLDCSFTGFSGKLIGQTQNGSDLELIEDSIMPASKLCLDADEITLGRLVLRRKSQSEDGQVTLAFSLVDGKIPLDGKLSRYLNQNFNESVNPYELELGSDKFNIATFITQDFSNIDIFDRARKFSVFYQDFKRTQRFAYFFAREGSKGARVNLSRLRKNGRRDYLMFGSNDYLGLASHPKVIEAANKATQVYGVGATGTPPTSGTSDLHDELCRKLATMYGKEDALVYSSGYNTNVGIISGLAREQDLIVADILSHASIQDGINMSRATARFFKHNDMKHLERILRDYREKYAGCMIITEGAFSMDGTVGKIDEIVALARKYNARVYIDQAHCIGVLGERGLGTVERHNAIHDTDLIMGLFSKSLGTVGGFVVGSKEVMTWLRWYSRAHMFATSFPPSIAAATLASLEIVEQQPELRAHLRKNIQHFITGLIAIGVPVNPQHETTIIPVEIRDEGKMGKICESLLDDGVYSLPVIFPAVAKNRCRFRFSIRADHTISDLDYALNSLSKAIVTADFNFTQLREEMAKESETNKTT